MNVLRYDLMLECGFKLIEVLEKGDMDFTKEYSEGVSHILGQVPVSTCVKKVELVKKAIQYDST